jgi:hypothetical protein
MDAQPFRQPAIFKPPIIPSACQSFKQYHHSKTQIYSNLQAHLQKKLFFSKDYPKITAKKIG